MTSISTAGSTPRSANASSPQHLGHKRPAAADPTTSNSVDGGGTSAQPSKRRRTLGSQSNGVSSPRSVSSPQSKAGVPGVTNLFINNEYVMSKTRSWIPVYDPASQKLLTRVPDATLLEVQSAVNAAQSAYPSWAAQPFAKRRLKLLALLEIIRQNLSRIAEVVCLEAGKTVADAEAEVTRGIDSIETACSVGTEMCGMHLGNDTTESHTIHSPLGVCVAVTPFNFPFMILLWSMPYAIITGNTVVLKPSEKTPSPSMLLAEFAIQAGFPAGVLNIIHGAATAVDKLLAQPSVRAISFVGSDAAAERVFEHAQATRKRVQAECGGKNHGVILEDANETQTLYAIAGSAFGAAGQRCMAMSVAVFVGSTRTWIPKLVDIAASLSVGNGSDIGVDIGPLISAAAKQNVEGIIQRAVDEGATLLLDGRNPDVPQYPKGNFVGPTIFSDVQPYMECYQNEIFGPVLVCIEVETLDEAIDLINDNKYGNGCSLFTTSPVHAQTFQRSVDVGQIGINVPVLAAAGQVVRTGNKESFLGDRNVPGRTYWPFFTSTKTVTTRWR